MKISDLSQTAAFLAVKLYGLTRYDEFSALLDSEIVQYYEHIVKTLPSPVCHYHYWLKFKWVRYFYIQSEELMLPGDLLHILMRKTYLHKKVEKLVSQGYSQLIILGAGLDHLGTYFSRRGVRSLEIDIPKMIKIKKSILESGFKPNENLRFLAAKLPDDDLAEILADEAEIRSDEKTIIIAEGFFDYLNPKDVHCVLDSTNRYFKHKPVLLSTHFSLDELSKFHRWVFKSSVSMVGEKLRFGVDVEGFKAMLVNHKFKITEMVDSAALKKNLSIDPAFELSILPGLYIIRAGE